ncbi:MAG: Gldg family protein [Gammaproteobacteria bacterium]|nr:Gldg family protein [Gammaproteobacteria bacterium]
MNARLLTVSGLVIGVVILLAVNIVGNSVFQSARLDLTQNRLFTLSDGTRNILSALDEPVTLRFFLSRAAATRLPGINSYANRVREMLQEYERTANGNIDLQIIDPEPFSEQEDRAVGYGLQGVPLDDLNTVLYFGLVGTSSTDDEQVVPFFAVEREEFLEYDLTKLVHQLVNPKQPVVGLISTLPIAGSMGGNAMAMQGMQGMQAPWTIVEQMRQLFEVRSIGMQETTIADDVDVLMLVHPKELSDQLLYAIDQFVLRGGRAMVFVDPYAEADQAGGALGMGGDNASNLDVLFKQWGVDLPTEKVIGDLQTAARVQTTSDSRSVVVEYPVWMQIQPSQISTEDIVTADIGDLMFATAGQLTAKNGAGTQLTPLVQTTPNAAEVDKTNLGFGGDPQEILREYQPGGTALNLAVRVTGSVKTAFPDGVPLAQESNDDAQAEESEAKDTESKDTEAQEAEHLVESKEDVNLIVIADTDFLQDRFWVQVQNFLGSRMAIPTAGNGSFVVNALDNLVGSNDLISVRNRGSFSRPFTLVQTIRQDAELRFRQTEQKLLDELTATEQKLVELDQQKGGNESLILSVEQQQEIERFREEKVRIRKDLRNVRHELQKDIERVASVTKFANIGLMPLIIGVGAILFSVFKLRRRNHKRQDS